MLKNLSGRHLCFVFSALTKDEWHDIEWSLEFHLTSRLLYFRLSAFFPFFPCHDVSSLVGGGGQKTFLWIPEQSMGFWFIFEQIPQEYFGTLWQYSLMEPEFCWEQTGTELKEILKKSFSDTPLNPLCALNLVRNILDFEIYTQYHSYFSIFYYNKSVTPFLNEIKHSIVLGNISTYKFLILRPGYLVKNYYK